MKIKLFLLFVYMGVLVMLVSGGCFEKIENGTWQDIAEGLYFLSGGILGMSGLLYLMFTPTGMTPFKDVILLGLTSSIVGFTAVFMVLG
ncbi:MAG TPA: hypothetical protein EYG89_03585 [Bacteroidia bacterium]|nr:hypothetical protein [Bacteroidia bacterium]